MTLIKNRSIANLISEKLATVKRFQGQRFECWLYQTDVELTMETSTIESLDGGQFNLYQLSDVNFKIFEQRSYHAG